MAGVFVYQTTDKPGSVEANHLSSPGVATKIERFL